MSTAARPSKSKRQPFSPERYIPDFDPYGYSPYDPKFEGDRRNGSAERRKSVAAPGYRQKDDASDSDDYYKSSSARRHSSATEKKRHPRPKGSSRRHHDDYPRSRSRRNSDDEWDTDYDPRDKYYLSGDDSDHKDHRAMTKRRDLSRDADSGYSSRHSTSSKPSNRSSTSSRREADTPRRPGSSRSVSGGGSGAAAAGHHRPRAAPRSYSGATRSRRYPPSASRSKPAKPPLRQQIPWEHAMKAAMKAGAICAIKVGTMPGGTIFDKGIKVASAGLGAAVIDTFMNEHHPKTKGGVRHAAIKHAAELALGSMVVGPAAKSLSGKR